MLSRKEYKQKQYEAHLAKLRAITKEKVSDSDMHSQDAFGSSCAFWHGKLMFLLTCATMYYLGIKKMWLVYAIRACPNPLEFAIGHGGKCIFVCIAFLMFCHVVQSLVRFILYHLFCLVKGYEPLSLLDQFWLYDMPANPMNVPSILVIERPSAD